MELGVEALAAAVERAIVQLDVAVGSRFRTEQQMAERLGISRWRLRDALNLLVDRGILFRQRGSGTFLRMLPSVSPEPSPEITTMVIRAEDLLPIPPAGMEPHGDEVLSSFGRPLRIGLLCDLNSGSHTTREIQACLVRAINARGHQLNIQSSTHRDIELLSPQEIVRQFPEDPCDGHIVQAEAAQHFYEALAALPSATPRVPVVFYGNKTELHVPGAFIGLSGMFESLAHAFELFADQGLDRIGMIRLKRNRHRLGVRKYDELAEYYDTMLRRHQLSYHALEHTQSEAAESVLDAMHATLRLMRRTPRPQAFFVSDDHLMPGVLEALNQLKCEPGRDVGVTTIRHRRRSLPGPYDWSCFEYVSENVADLVISTLLRSIQNPNHVPSSSHLLPAWREGKTHLVSL